MFKAKYVVFVGVTVRIMNSLNEKVRSVTHLSNLQDRMNVVQIHSEIILRHIIHHS